MKCRFLLSLLLAATINTLTWADKDMNGLRQSAVFSANNSPYDQQSLSDQSPTNTRVIHSATSAPQNSFGFGQDVQGKQFGQVSAFGASGAAADSSASYSAYPQKYPDSSSGGYPSTSYNPAPSPGGYLPPPVVSGGYPASIQQPKPQYGQPAQTGESYAYHYQHYPQSHHHHDYGTESHSQSHSLFDGDLFGGLSGLGGLSSLGGGLGGEEGGFGGAGGPGIAAVAGIKAIKALKGIGILAKIAKDVLLVKPFIILGLLLLVALPFIILFFPIPIITIANPPGLRANTAETLTAYMSELTSKVFNAEECLERIICKLPEVPPKYKGKAKGVWEEFGTKYITNGRITRGLSAYFEDNSGENSKNRSFKCDQKFKCSSKFF